MCDTDFDPCTIFDVTTPKARKQHTCGECDLPILPGRNYVRIGTLFEGRWGTFRIHAECYALMTFIEKEVCHGHGSILLGGLDEEISNLDSYDGGADVFSPDPKADEADLIAMGLGEVETDGDETILHAGQKDICEWLWDCIRAEYQPEARAA